jgi:hypothetical protein
VAIVVRDSREPNKTESGNCMEPLAKDQCVYWEKKRHWARDCPKKKKRGNGGSEARKEILFYIPSPTSSRQVRQFLGIAGFYRL